MSCNDYFLKQLRLQGLRLTPQRKLVLLLMHEVGHPATAEEIYNLVITRTNDIELSTVYRTLDLLNSMSLVTIINKGDKQRFYELVVGGLPHLHLACKQCGKITGIDLDQIHPLQQQLFVENHFQLDLSNITLAGLCENCQAKD